MHVANKISSAELDRHQQQLTVLACIFIGILAAGTALMMYPVVFSHEVPASNKTLRYAFVGFCTLCGLLVVYIWNTQATIRSLRRERDQERKRFVEAGRQASEELLKTIPKLNSFQDLLPMEYRRAIAASENLSVLVVTVYSLVLESPSGEVVILGDAAKAMSRKLRAQDSVYLLGASSFGAVLPGVDLQTARGISARVAEGLTDAAGAGDRFSFKIDIVNYPHDAASAHELQEAVRSLIPSDESVHGLAQPVIQ